MPVEISSVANAFAKLGLELPAGARRVAEVRTAALKAATARPTEELRVSLLGGHLNAENVQDRVDQAALSLVVREKAREVLRDLEATFALLTAQALREEGDAIVRAMRPTFDQAAATLAEAVATLGNLSESQAMRASASLANAWHSREAALATLNLVRRARSELAEAGYGPPESAAWYLAEARTPEQLHEANQVWQRERRFLGLAGHGFALHLNTGSEAMTLVTGARTALEQREAEAAEAKRQHNEAEAERIVRPWRELAPRR